MVEATVVDVPLVVEKEEMMAARCVAKPFIAVLEDWRWPTYMKSGLSLLTMIRRVVIGLLE